MYKPPENEAIEQIISKLYPNNKGFNFPRCEITYTRNGDRLVSTEAHVKLSRWRKTSVKICLTRSARTWVEGEVSTEFGKYEVIFVDGIPIPYPA